MAKGADKRTNRQCLDDFEDALRGLEAGIEESEGEGHGLNVFEVLGITNAEIRHSNFLAWLMGPDGGHGLGGALAGALLAHAGGAPGTDVRDWRVLRESDNIDILAVSKTLHATLAIENKVWSGEHDDQLARYRRIVERRYPEWEHRYLFLSPYGMPPEGEGDRESWVPIDYRVLLGHIERAAEGREVPEKARMLIGDYAESVRRHIVGDERLQDRCVEIYLGHRRAIDLIMRNLPDTTKTVHQYVRDWAMRKDGLEVVEECSRGKQYVRFRTPGMEGRFPPVDGADNWGQHHFWFYEVITKPAKDRIGCDLSFQLCFHLPKGAPLDEGRVAASHSYTDAFSGDGSGVFHGTWTGYYAYVAYFSPSVTYDEIFDACDSTWEDFLLREERADKAVFG